MKKLLVAVLILGAMVVAGGGWIAVRYFRKERSEKIHFERQETEVIITNLANAPLRLFKAGKHLHDAAEIEGFAGPQASQSLRVWLPPGNYFLRVDLPNQPAFYPIPITGFRRGPDAEGSFAVTVRSPASDPPPRLGDRSEWAFVPSGNFLIGDRLNPREPHYVWLPTFYIGAFEVTNAEFREFVRDPQGYANDAFWTEAGKAWKADNPSQATALLIESHPEFNRFGRDDQPVTWVTWHEAAAYCKWMTKKFEQRRWLFSLPSEAEWEKVARGPDNFDFALSSLLSDEESNLYNWKKNPGAPETVVGIEETKARFRPNRYGVFHLSGNVVEWTRTLNRPYNRERPYADDDGRNRDDSVDVRVVRGGSWYSAGIALLSIAYRDTFQPEVRHHDLGFRVVARPLP